MNQLCTSVILKILIGTQTAFYNKRTLIHLTGPDMWDLFLYIDCFSAKSWYFRLLHSKIFFFSILDFKWMFWITKVFVCSSYLNFWHYTHTSIFLTLFTNQNCSNGGLIICTPTRTTVLQYVISHTYNSCILILGRFNLFKPSWL